MLVSLGAGLLLLQGRKSGEGGVVLGEAIAILISAAISAMVAYNVAIKTVDHDRVRTAKRAALDIIARELDPSWTAIRATARQTVTNPDYWNAVINPQRDQDFSRRAAVVAFLNHHEMIAVAIKQGAVDEDLLKDWAHATYVHMWDISEVFVERWRGETKHKPALSNFKALAVKWKGSLPEHISSMELNVAAPSELKQQL